VNLIYEAVVSSPNWPNTVLVITYDEWGGFSIMCPHRPPPSAPGSWASGRPPRVPRADVIVSPWTPRGTVGHSLYDHTSVLRMIEWRWSCRRYRARCHGQ
jgi:phospholipase C